MNSSKLKAGLALIVMCFSVIVAAQPANDDVCSATNLTVNGVASCFSTSGATTNADPSHGCGTPATTVWFKFTAPASGTVKISTDKTGTSFNTIIALFSSASCSGPFTEFACNDDGNQVVVATSSDLNLSCLTPFESYYIMVDGVGGATGMVCIAVTNNGGTALGADFSCGFGANSPGLPILQANGTTLCVTNKCAGTDVDDPTGATWSDGPENSIWFLFLAPASGSVKITTDKAGTTFNNQIAVYESACPYLLAVPLASDEGSGATPGTSELSVCGLTPNGSYWIQVDGVAADTGTVCISVSNLSSGNRQPGSNAICNASTLSVGGATSFFQNLCADRDSVEPAGSNWKAPGNAEKTTWHKFVAPVSGNVTISTDFPQTNFDIQLAVYSSSDGTCNGTLIEINSDDDSGTGLTAELALGCLNSGVTYFIQVDGYAADSGDYGISVTGNPGGFVSGNDSICDASILTVDNAPVSSSNLCADTEPGETVPACFSLENSIYFAFTPPASGSVTINFTNTTFSLEFAVFKVLDAMCSDTVNLDEVNCDGTPLTNPSLPLSCLDPSGVYIILVDGAAGATGAFDIQVQGNAGVSIGSDNACQSSSIQLIANGSIKVLTNDCAGTESGEPVPPTGTSGITACTSNNGWCDTEPPAIENTIWASFKPTLSGFTAISTDNDSTNFDTQLAVWEVNNCSNFGGYVLVAANDNCPGGCTSANGNPLASRLTFCADSSKTYYVQIDGFGGATGNVGISATVVPLSAFAGNDTTVCADEDMVLLGIGGVSYLWSTGATTALITVHPLVATTYTLTVTGANGCTASDAVRVTVDYIFPDANAGNDTFTCALSPVILKATGGISYKWNTGDTTAFTTVSPSINSNYSVTVTGPNGCKDIDVVAVSVLQVPQANAGNDTTICIGSSANLKATGGVSYYWSTGQTTSSILVFPSADSTFHVTVTAANGCTASDAVRVFVAPFPVVDLGNDTSICLGSSVILSTNALGNYLWSTGNTTSSITVRPSSDSVFTVRVTNASGCASFDSVQITVNALPAVSINSDTSICIGESVQLIAGGGGSYLWSTGGTTASIMVAPILTEIYSVTVTNGCVDSTTTKVTVNDLPVADAGSDLTICYQQSGLLTAGGAGFTFSWSTGATTQAITVKPAVDSTFHVTVTDANGCSDTDDATVFVYANPILAISKDTVICIGSSVPLSVTGGDSYSWNTGETTSGILVTPDSVTRYIVAVTDSNLCVVRDTIVVFALPPPVANAGNDVSICLGDNALFMASGGTSYLWSTGETTASIIVSPVVDTDYIVLATTGNSCTDSDTVTVTVKPLPSVILADTSICVGESVLLDAGNAGVSYIWSTGDTTQTITVNAGTYSVTVFGSNGCNGFGNSTVSNFASIMLTLNDQNICSGISVMLDAGNPGASYLWSTGETAQTIIVNDSGSYSVTVTDINNCSKADTNVVGVFDIPLVDAGIDDSICIGETAILVASGGITFIWSNGETSNILNISPVVNSTYSVTATDVNMCSASDSASVFVNDLPMVSLTLDSIFCINAGPRALSGGSPSGGVYSGVGVSGTNFNPAAAGLGSHIITYDFVDSNHCAGSAQFTVLVDLCTYVQLNSNDFKVRAYPNPFENKIMLNIENDKTEDVYLRLMDVLGKKIVEQRETVFEGSNTFTIQPGDISSGIYILEVEIGGNIYPVKLSRLF